jgi:hypothetical protein
MLNALNGLDKSSIHGWIKFDKSWKNIKNKIIYQLNCSIKPIFKHTGDKSERVELSDKYIIKRLIVIASEDGKLEAVDLGKQEHPHKDPKNNRFCLGKLERIQVNPTLVFVLMACLLKYNSYDCFSLPTNSKENTEGN